MSSEANASAPDRHMDHSGGIPAVVAGVGPARAEAGRPPMVLDLHPDRPRQRGVKMPPQFGGGVLLFSEVCGHPSPA